MTLATSVPQFYRLDITDRREESHDGFSLALQVPLALRSVFKFEHGQYLTLRANVNEEPLRRSYSICNGTDGYEKTGELRIGIKRVNNGLFSQYAHANFTVGKSIELMPPQGRFTRKLNPDVSTHYLGFAGGSGITPILSFMHSVLALEPNSRFTLVYGNRSADQIMFLETIEGLKNRYMERVRLVHVLSQQPQECELFNGRITGAKVSALLTDLIKVSSSDVALICGPNSMIDEVSTALLEAGMTANNILSERFGTPITSGIRRVVSPPEASAPSARLKVIVNGKTREMRLPFEGIKLLDVALAQGLDLPYACKGGVCCTCRAKVIEGKVVMEKNYTLEQWEIDKGFVLTCQCSPVSNEVTVSFDEQ